MPLSKKTAPKSYGKSSVFFKKKCIVFNLPVFKVLIKKQKTIYFFNKPKNTGVNLRGQ
jgi:hypothetical protein